MLAACLRPLPVSPDAATALDALRRVATAQEQADALDALSPETYAFLGNTFGDAPYLLDLATKDLARLLSILADDPVRRVETIASDPFPGDAKTVASLLRRAKGDVALTLALADLGGAIALEDVTRLLSRFADRALDAALGAALDAERARGRWTGGGPETSGLALLAMGKHGADELNYSSDIDIIAVYDPDVSGRGSGVDAGPFYVRLVQSIVRTLQDRTADGYVFRTDLRLRPDPAATPVAISLPAALSYYESLGQNWERAALIKARPAAGDRQVGAAFLKEIRPFIWRRHLDYAAIADIQSIKRQVHAHHGHGRVAVAGHDVKRGRGGIREIELFAQTQQLIAGGRDPLLRGIATVPTLAALCAQGWITERARDVLSESYRFLRSLEHRIQMRKDEQTHVIPAEAGQRAAVGRLMGFADMGAFETAVTDVLSGVAERYDRLFEKERALGGAAGSLVFTGGEDDPDTLRTLAGMGFRAPERVTEAVRAWHFGRFPAMRSQRARETLTEITPALLAAFGGSADPDAAFAAFDQLLKGLPAGVQLFAALGQNPKLLDLLALLLGAAPRLAETFARRPSVLGAFLDPAVLAESVSREAQGERLARALAGVDRGGADRFEALLDRARLHVREHRFLLSVRLLTGQLAPDDAGPAFSALAEATLDALLAAVMGEMVAAHGRVSGARHAVLAMGKLGSAEMTAASDLDLIVIYDHPEEAGASDGRRPLSPPQYYARATQRLVAALSAPMAEGIAYPVDLRLRPSGRAGPLAVRLDSFRRYQEEEAWTWEHMALSRARIVAGDAGLGAEVEAVIAAVLARPRDRARLAADVRAMRRRIEEAKPGRSPFAFKTAPGGLVDAEFTAQFAVLAGLSRIPAEGVAATLRRAGEAGFLPPADAETLAGAARLQSALAQCFAATSDGAAEEAAEVFAGLGAALLRIAATVWPEGAEPPADVPTLADRLAAIQHEARAAFLRAVPDPAPDAVEPTG